VEEAYSDECKGAGPGSEPVRCSHTEQMIVAASRECADGAFVFVGTGLPLVACMLAQRTCASNMTIVMESGVVGPTFEHLPISVADPRVAVQCSTISGMAEVFGSVALRGYCTIGMLGGAQCDRYGNLNSTRVGDTRLAGSGGATAIAAYADSIVAMLPHEPRRFPEQCAYLSSVAGARGGRGSIEHRWRHGLYRGGRLTVITTLGILRSSEDGELSLAAIYPGVDERMVYQNTGWPLRRSEEFHVMEPPADETLDTLRHVIDPSGIYLNRGSRTQR
jgi:glutaconate CoA-transferase, subunit B